MNIGQPISATRTSVKISNLRKNGYSDLENWMTNPDNLYVGRKGRVNIVYPNGESKIFFYPDSKWRNPFKLKEYSTEQCIELYKKHLYESGLYLQIAELHGKNLGCFCLPENRCHIDIILELIQNFNNSICNNKIIPEFVFN